MTISLRGRRAAIRSGLVVAVSMGLMNAATYLFNIVAAPWLGPRDYGAVAAVLSVLTVVNVIALGLQATAARRVAAQPGLVAQIETDVLRTTYWAAGAVGVAGLALAPVIDRALRLDSLPTAMLIAVAATPLTVMGGQAGLLQGESRWVPLSLVYLGFGFGRLVASVATMSVLPDQLGATLGIAVGAFVPVTVGAWALHRRRRDRPVVDTALHQPAGRVLREVLTSSHALLAFFALSNVDILLARATMTPHEAGLYAGGLILTKAVLFLPQFVVVILFPSMARQTRGGAPWTGLALIAGIGVVAVTGTALLSRVSVPNADAVDGRVALSVLFVGGPAYDALREDLWWWAALGMLLAMLQLLVYGVIARRDGAAVYVVWTGLAVVLTSAPFLASPSGLLTVVLFVDSVLLVVLTLVALVGRGVPARAGAD